MSKPISISLPVTEAQAEAVIAAGPGATVHHPRATSIPGRRQLSTALTVAGVPSRLVKTLAWQGHGAPHAPAEPPKRTAPSRAGNASKQSPVDEA